MIANQSVFGYQTQSVDNALTDQNSIERIPVRAGQNIEMLDMSRVNRENLHTRSCNVSLPPGQGIGHQSCGTAFLANHLPERSAADQEVPFLDHAPGGRRQPVWIVDGPNKR